MNRHFEAIEQREQLKKALLQTYDLLIGKLESDEINEGKIYRLTAMIGHTPDGLPIQVNLELNLNAATFQPLHSIVTYKQPPFQADEPWRQANGKYAVEVDDLFLMNGD